MQRPEQAPPPVRSRSKDTPPKINFSRSEKSDELSAASVLLNTSTSHGSSTYVDDEITHESSNSNSNSNTNSNDTYDYRFMHAALVESWMDVGMNTGTEKANNCAENGKNQRWRSHTIANNHALHATLEIMRTKSLQRSGEIIKTGTKQHHNHHHLSKTSTAGQKNRTNNRGGNQNKNLTEILEHEPASPTTNQNDVSMFTTATNSSLLDEEEDINDNNVNNDNDDDDCAHSTSTEDSDVMDDDENDTTELLELAAFLNVNCSLEKRGPHETKERVIGREHALEKLEQKAAVLREAGRRNVELCEVFLMRCGDETRSLIKIKVGFLTFRYGLLLKWKNGLVNFIVLYKMAPDSFLVDDTELPPVQVVEEEQQPSLSASSSSKNHKNHNSNNKNHPARFLYIDHTHDTCTVVLETRNHLNQIGTEVTILQPPWLVPRPDNFKPPTVHVTILKAQGLRNTIGPDPLGMMSTLMPIHSYVKVSTSLASHRTGVVKMKRSPVWDSLDDNYAELELDYDTDRFLKVEICDSKPMKNRRLSVVYVPMAMVPLPRAPAYNNTMSGCDVVEPTAVKNVSTNRAEAQLQNQAATVITMPCRMRKSMGGGYGSITLALSTHDARRDWLQRELQARQNQLLAAVSQYEESSLAALCTPIMCGHGASTFAVSDVVGESADLADDVEEIAAWFRSWCMMC